MPLNSDIEFEFADSDSLLAELDEQYSYEETNDFSLNREAAIKLSKDIGHEIGSELFCKRALANLEILNSETRLNSIRSLLCILQGGSYIERRKLDFNERQPSETEQIMLNAELIYGIRYGSYEIIKLDGWNILINLLLSESKEIRKDEDIITRTYRQVSLRLIYSICYTLLEIMRRGPAPSDPDDWHKIQNNFIDELSEHVEHIGEILDIMVEEPVVVTTPLLPLKKISLLIWKLSLAIFGGFSQANTVKNRKRIAEGLPPLADPMETINKLTPVIAPIDVMSLNDDENTRQKPKLRREIQKYDDESSPSFINEPEDEKVLNSRPMTPVVGSMGRGTPKRYLVSSRPGSPELDPTKLNWCFPYLPWTPKVTMGEMNEYVSAARFKYLEYNFKHSDSELELQMINQNRFGLPKTIQNSLQVMDRYLYISLADRQKDKWKISEEHPLTQRYVPEQTPIEHLYKLIHNKIPMYVIALLKILLSASPTSNKGEILQQDQAHQGLQVFSDPKAFKLPAMLIGIDVARHKEITTKAISGFILLLLKHFKSSHVYQFEFLAQCLFASNCVPLIIKIFNQSMAAYVIQRNQIPLLDFHMAVRGIPIIQAQLERIEESKMPYCWRNMFSSTCFLRILMKIVKHKPWRSMSLVIFKSTPILKRAMIVKHGMFQLYLLKVIKVHARYLGRLWRKTNMGVVSAIYSMVRHHLTDDWAFANETEKRPWDFRDCESEMKNHCARFNKMYSNENSEWVENAHIINESEIQLPQQFDKNYESWINREVIAVSIDWDQLLMPVKDILLQ